MALALLSASLIAAAPVHLLETSPAPFAALFPDADPDAAVWYGWEPFLVDGTAVALFFGGGFLFGPQGLGPAQALTMVTSVGLYLAGGPLLHWVRGRPRTALVDLGLRAGLPVGGLIVGYVLAAGTGQGLSWVPTCFVFGLVAAIVTDVVALSWDPPGDSSQPRPEEAALRWAPFVGAARGSPLAGVAGTF